MSVRLVPLAEHHFAALGAELPPKASRGYACVDGDTVYGLFGWYPDRARFVLFGEVGRAARERSETFAIRRAFLSVRDKLAEITTSAPVHSLADPDVEGSARLLEHLGFRRVRGDVFELKGTS